MQQSNYHLLLDKLDEFIRKYYKNQLIRGGIYSFTIGLLFYLLVNVLEYFGHFETTLRTVLFYSFVLTNAYILVKLVFIPLFKLNKLGNIISHTQAAEIIGKHFAQVQDKLLNVLQLHQQITASGNQGEGESEMTQSTILITAGINQKIKELKYIPFSSAINLSENKKYLKYALIPIVILLIIMFSNSSVITGSTNRLIKHSTYFEKPAPFHFVIQNAALQTFQQQDFELTVKIEGNEIPENVYLEIDKNQYKLEKESTISFRYLFKNIQKNISFRLFGDGYYSHPYELVALPNPVVLNFEVMLEYPAYLQKAKEKIQNTGDLIIPAGTKVNWNFVTKNTDILKISFKDTAIEIPHREQNLFVFTKRFLKNDNYAIATSNSYLKNKDSIQYAITVIPDMYPSIETEQQADSVSGKQFYFKGLIKDDYGFSKLAFNYHFLKKQSDSLNPKSSIPNPQSELIPMNKNSTQEQFFYLWDMNNIGLSAGDEIEYYFEVWDNDGVTGSKSTKSQTAVFKAPTLKEIAEKTSKKNDEIKSDLKESIRAAKALQKELSDFQRNLFEKKNLTWEDKKKAQDLLNKQKELTQKVEDIQKENKQNTAQQSEYKEANNDMVEKQQQLKQLMDELLTDEMKKQFEELEKLLQQTDKQKLQEQIEKMKFSNKDLEKELDRTLEIFKQMEFQQKLQESIDKLDKLAKEQKQLSEKSLDKKADNKELQQKQNEKTSEFQDIKKDLKELEKKNQALQNPEPMKNTEQQQNEIQQEMKNSEQQLGENKNKKASQSQKNAAEKMEQLSEQLKEMQDAAEDEQMEEDVAALRMLLENLLKLSFTQEQLMQDLKNIDINNPKYLKLSQQQRKLQDDAKMIEDSMFALSKRIVQIQSSVNREASAINQNMEKALDNLEERKVQDARSRQQYVMTSVNNLALLLNESLDALQKQMAQSMKKKEGKGKGSCKKPGSCTKPGSGKKPNSMSMMRMMQEQLNKQIQQLKENGNKPNGKQGGQGMSEQLARLAAQQEMLRNEMQKYNQQNNKDGKGSLGDLNKIAKEMEQTETDLVNKMLTQETIRRQQEILTRLLESEKAERERDQDEKRESNEGKNEMNRNPNEFEQYKRLKQKEMELLKTVPPSLNPYYKKKVNDYFQSIEN